MTAHDRVLGILVGWAESKASRNLRKRLEDAITKAVQQARDRAFRDAANIARAIDSGRGNEAEIANALEGRQGTQAIEARGQLERGGETE